MEGIEIVLHLRLTLAAVPGARELLKRPFIALILLISTLPVFAQTIGTTDVIVVQENAFWKAYIDLMGFIGTTKVMPCYKALGSRRCDEFFRSL